MGNAARDGGVRHGEAFRGLPRGPNDSAGVVVQSATFPGYRPLGRAGESLALRRCMFHAIGQAYNLGIAGTRPEIKSRGVENYRGETEKWMTPSEIRARPDLIRLQSMGRSDAARSQIRKAPPSSFPSFLPPALLLLRLRGVAFVDAVVLIGLPGHKAAAAVFGIPSACVPPASRIPPQSQLTGEEEKPPPESAREGDRVSASVSIRDPRNHKPRVSGTLSHVGPVS